MRMTQAALSRAPSSMYGRRRPQRLRVLSLMLPITGSMMASQNRGTSIATPSSVGLTPRAML